MSTSASHTNEKSDHNSTAELASTRSISGRVLKKLFTLWSLRKLKLAQLTDWLLLRSPSSKQIFMLSLFLWLISAFLYHSDQSLGFFTFAGLASILTAFCAVKFIEREYLFQKAIHMSRENKIRLQTVSPLRELWITDETIIALLKEGMSKREIKLAQWDQNNRVLSHIGPIRLFAGDEITADQFIPRERNQFQLVLRDGKLMVKKSFRTRACLKNEVLALNKLHELEYVPKLLEVNQFNKTVYMSFLPGTNLGSRLHASGFRVTDQHKLVSGKLSDLSQLALLSKVFSNDQVNELVDKVREIHQKGIAIRDIKYGNIILSKNGIQICDFDAALTRKVSNFTLFKARCADIARLNLLFNLNLPAEGNLAQYQQNISPESYAPIYIGKGIKYGKVGSVEFGTGKWHLIKDSLPNFKGKDIVDLGSNNANLPMEMLRQGANKVLGFELNPSVYRLALRNKQLYDLVDNKDYALDLVNDYMHGVLLKDIREFDVATSFCSLYYESPEMMEKITNFLSQHVKMFIVQANENKDEHEGEMLTRSSVEYLQDVLKRNGFIKQRVVRFPFYDRPLILAHADSAQ